MIAVIFNGICGTNEYSSIKLYIHPPNIFLEIIIYNKINIENNKM